MNGLIFMDQGNDTLFTIVEENFDLGTYRVRIIDSPPWVGRPRPWMNYISDLDLQRCELVPFQTVFDL